MLELNSLGNKDEFIQLLEKRSGLDLKMATDFIEFLLDTRQVVEEDEYFTDSQYSAMFLDNWERFFDTKYNTKFYPKS